MKVLSQIEFLEENLKILLISGGVCLTGIVEIFLWKNKKINYF